MFAKTNTPTTGGLESFFDKDSFLGLKLNPTIILSLSLVWSLKTCIFQHIKMIAKEKGFCTFKTKISIFMWATFATVRRVASIIVFFTPSMGLFSILHHWQAENTPFKTRLDDIKRNRSTEFDNINLYNMTQTVRWSHLDRWSYDDPQHPQPPPYSIYTGLSLQYYFLAFIGIFVLQIILMDRVKSHTSDEYRKMKDFFSKWTHLILVASLPFPYKDWDVGSFDSIKIFRDRYKKTEREMMVSYLVNFLFTVIMLIPLCLTGTGSSRESVI